MYLQEHATHSGFGQFLGWLMAAIYMGGRLPQIWLNVGIKFWIFLFFLIFIIILKFIYFIFLPDQKRKCGGAESPHVRVCVGCQCHLCSKVRFVFSILTSISISGFLISSSRWMNAVLSWEVRNGIKSKLTCRGCSMPLFASSSTYSYPFSWSFYTMIWFEMWKP